MPRSTRCYCKSLNPIFLLAIVLLAGASGICAAQSSAYLTYVGTYTDHGDSKGIYGYRFDSKTGKLTSLGLEAETDNPTFLALNPERGLLYAANEIVTFNGQPTGSVSAFAIDSATGKLSLINQVSSKSPGPAYISLDRTEKFVLTANYPVGSVTVFPVLDNGGVGEASAFVQHTGSSVNTDRQTGPHGHAIELSPDNRFALAADLGTDQILIYPFDQSNGTLGPAHIHKIAPGSGPRHLIFSADGKFVYLISEMAATVTFFSYDATGGNLTDLQTISTLPKHFSGKNTSAEIRLSASGQFLYASNRGPDNIAVFKVNKSKGTLTTVAFVPTGGKTPRNFTIDPSGTWLLAANQGSDNIVVFRIDHKTGWLNPTKETVQISAPVCVTFDVPMP